MPHDGNPLLIQGNVAERLAALTSRYNASKTEHEALRDQWQNAIYDAWCGGVSIANLSMWVGVSQARIGAILSRITAVRQKQAALAPAAVPQPLRPAA